MEFAWIKGVIHNRRLTLCGLQVTGVREKQYKVEQPFPTCCKPRHQIRGLAKNRSFENQFCLRVNIKLFSSERRSTRNLFKNKAKDNFEIAIKRWTAHVQQVRMTLERWPNGSKQGDPPLESDWASPEIKYVNSTKNKYGYLWLN